MNQLLIPSFTGAEIVKANFKGKLMTITKARVAPGICTVEYKQAETCKQNLQCCPVKPKPILADHRGNDKLMLQSNFCQFKSLFFNMWIKRRTSPNPLLPTPNLKQNKTKVKKQ
jgi:hypothetical protein